MPDSVPHGTILVVDDDAATCTALRRALQQEGYDVVTCRSGEEALDVLASADVQVLITDLVMGGMSGVALLGQAQTSHPDVPVVVCTGYGSIRSAVEAMHKGAADYLTKPVDLDALLLVVRRAIRTSALSEENRSLRRQLLDRHRLHGLTGRAPAIRALYETIETVAPVDVTVLIRGESGTGKEVLARAIHMTSSRSAAPLMVVDCAAIAESLIESELFGHERGAFTGADRQKKGKLEGADGATLFLDEVGELSMVAQTRLLRFLQDHAFQRVGGTEFIDADVRVLAATNRSLERMIEARTFREDLYYRLNVVSLEMPPLRERREDIELLTQEFVESLSREHGLEAPVLHRSARAALTSYDWPGNVRELRNLCENLVVRAAGAVVTSAELPMHISSPSAEPEDPGLLDGSHRLAEIERQAIVQTLAAARGNKAEAARVLGIGLKTLYRRLAEYEEIDR